MEIIKPYRRAGVPLVALECADGAVVVATVKRECVNGTVPCIVQWDCVRGLAGVTPPGADWVAAVCGGMDTAAASGNPIEAARMLAGLPEKGVAVMLGAHIAMQDQQARGAYCQALWNLRDVLKAVGACVVLCVPLGYKLPVDIAGDCVAAVLPLPGESEHKTAIAGLVADAGLSSIGENETARAAEAVAGLSAFAAEQSVALSLSKSGLDMGALWDRKRKMIEQTRGLGVWRGGDNFAGLGGLENAKGLFRRVIGGKRRPRVVVWIDEVEKAFAGSASDSSGVSQGFLGVTLSEMEDNAYSGAVLYGHPGTGKSAIAKALAGEIGCICIRFDLGAMKGSLVGESEAAIRSAWQVVKAVGGHGGALVLATCNAMDNLPAEFLARFRLGTLFFDLPTSEEQATIWRVWRERFGIAADDIAPECSGWVGREIASCCDLADRLGCTLREAAQYVVPVCKSSAEVIEARRVKASGKYLSASVPGVYRYERQAGPIGRKMEVGG